MRYQISQEISRHHLDALAAARSHPDFKAFAQRLIANGKSKRLVLNAIARKLVVLANAMLRPNQIADQLT